MPSATRVLGQILTAVGLTLAAGGIASFLWSKVELRFLGNVLESDRSRTIWMVVALAISLSGIALLRGARRARRS